MNEKDKFFCIAPWVHTHVLANGGRKVCCFSSDLGEDFVPFEEFWNGDYLKSIRKDFLEDRIPKGCEGCQFNVEFNEQFSDFVSNDLKTDQNHPPVSLDYRFGNLCNFSCRMCNSDFSSVIEGMEKKAGLNLRKSIDPKIVTEAKKELKDFLDSKKIQSLYFADGEPLISSAFNEALDKLILNDEAKNVFLTFNTNLSLINDESIEKLKKFKRVTINLSLDGVGETGEFIRTGLNFEHFKKNLKKLKQVNHFELILLTTLTIPSLLELDHLLKFAQEEELKLNFTYPVAQGSSIFFLPHLIPEEDLQQIKVGLIERTKNLNSYSHGRIKEAFRLIFQNFENKIDKKEVYEALRYLRKIDEQRKSISTESWYLEREELKGFMQWVLSAAPKNKSRLELLFPFQDIHSLEDFRNSPYLKSHGLNEINIIHPSESLFAQVLRFLKRRGVAVKPLEVSKIFEDLGFHLEQQTPMTFNDELFKNKALNSIFNFFRILFPKLFNLHTKMKFKREAHLRFCEIPFKTLEICTDETNRYTYNYCCPQWLKLENVPNDSFDLDAVWNSENAMKLRESILDGSYKYCNELHCTKLHDNTLPYQDEVTDNFLKEVIEKKQSRLESPPRVIKLSNDSSCNLSCPSCRTDVIMMNTPAFEDKYRELDAKIINPSLNNLEEIVLCTSGDIFSSRYYREYLLNFNIEKFSKVQFSIITNGLLLTPKMWERLSRLKNNIKTIDISIDAAHSDTYKIVRRGGDFLYLMNNLKFLSKLRKENEINHLGISFIVQTQNFREMADFVKMGIALNVDKVHFSRIADWHTFSQQVYEQHSIWMKSHPEHNDFLNVLKDPVFKHPCVNMGDIYEFMT